MEFHVRLHEAEIDIAVIEDGLLELDPASLADIDGAGTLRVATSADEGGIARVLAVAGHAVRLEDVVRQPSVCCGSCSG